jgi:hypothetical protein
MEKHQHAQADEGGCANVGVGIGHATRDGG